ncbi:5'-AMP-activated protein kinase subunit gamma-2 [Tyrophagus putrescentiae]|nr:5'-AMP-activated protein kinase subunit gamma-2 [Tyrophagus putrescentiae]
MNNMQVAVRKLKRKFFRSQSSLTITHQDSICDREFEDIDENLVYVKFFKFYRTYDIVPISAKLVVFDTLLAVKKAFFALLSNGVRAAPLWDSARHAFVGMLTITDFILILRTYYNSPDLRIEELEDHKLDIWRNMLKEKSRPLVSIGPDESLFNAIKTLIHNKVHRLPVIDSESGNVLYILTHKRILKFLFLYYYSRLPMPSYLYKTLRDLPTIGTYENIAVATQNMPLIQTLNLMVDRRVSALPIVDKRNKVVEIYAKFDVIHLAADKAYQNLDIPVKKALEYRSHSERIIKCTMNDTLHAVLEKIVQAEVHRIIVVNNDDHVIGIISLSDLLTFLVLRPVGMEQKDIMATSVTAVSQNINCCKVVLEETAEEVALSDSQSSSGGSSAADLTAQDRAQLGPDGLAGFWKRQIN